ncbi:MAG: hypothetical protein ACE5GH_04760 [Fidelibacterota bacterium]
MPDINLFDNPGFQEAVPVKGAPAVATTRDETKKKRKQTKSFRWEEFTAFLVMVGIGLLVAWYFSLKWSVKSEVKEYSPREFRLETGDHPGVPGGSGPSDS